jgi:hypothetical protein
MGEQGKPDLSKSLPAPTNVQLGTYSGSDSRSRGVKTKKQKIRVTFSPLPNQSVLRSKLWIPTRKRVTFSPNYNSLTPSFSRVFSKRNISCHTAFHVFITSNN